MAKLEDAKYCFAFSSGCASTATILATLKKGDHVLSVDDTYGGTKRNFQTTFQKLGIETTLIDFTDLENVEKNIRRNTKLIWMETPTNPLLKICDIQEVCKIAKERKVTTLVDNTFCSPIL